MAQEICLLLAVGPELDGVGEGVHGLRVAADEGAAEVDVGEGVVGGLEVGDLADVIATSHQVRRVKGGGRGDGEIEPT